MLWNYCKSLIVVGRKSIMNNHIANENGQLDDLDQHENVIKHKK